MLVTKETESDERPENRNSPANIYYSKEGLSDMKKTFRQFSEQVYDIYEQGRRRYVGRHGQTDAQYADSRSSGGKMVSGTSTQSGAEYTHGRRVKAGNPGMQPDPGGSTRPQSQGRMDRGTRTDLEYRRANLRNSSRSGRTGRGGGGGFTAPRTATYGSRYLNDADLSPGDMMHRGGV